MVTNLDGGTRLSETWHRLEAVCQRLWDADAPAAIELQSAIEEFKGESDRAVQTIRDLHQHNAGLHETMAKHVEQACSERSRELLLQLKRAEERAVAQEAELAKKEEYIQRLLRELAAKEAENLGFHEKFLHDAAQQDEARAKKMDSFYEELLKKETAMEVRWEARHAALEAEHKQRTEALKAKHEDLLAELRVRVVKVAEQSAKREEEIERAQENLRAERGSWEATRFEEQQALSRRRNEISLQSESLACEYRKKLEGLQQAKQVMQAELAEVVSQYQARLHSSGG